MRRVKKHLNSTMVPMVIIILLFVMLSGCAKFVLNKNIDVSNRIDEYVKAFNDVSTNQKISGNILIAKKGKIIVNNSYGMADYKNKIPISQDTVFRLCSTSKFFTALGIMQLYEKGLLDLNDKVSKYIPEQTRGSDMTIHQLLTHTSGLIRDAGEVGDISSYGYTPLDKLVSIIGKRDLVYEPGTTMSYSNAGYQMLAYIIEKVSKQSYEEYMRNNIFIPAGMNNTGVDPSNNEIANMALGYEYSYGIYNKKRQFNSSSFFGSGNIYSTAYDMYLFDKALTEGKIVSGEALNKMTCDNTGLGVNYGYGCMMGEVDGHRWVGHAGNLNSGYASNYIRFPDDDVTIILLFNTTWNENDSIMSAVSAIALGEKYRLPVKKQVISLEDSELEKFAGKYAGPYGIVLTVEKTGDGLSVIQDTVEVYIAPCSKTEFVQPGREYYEHVFEFDKDGNVVDYIVRYGAIEYKFKKIE